MNTARTSSAQTSLQTTRDPRPCALPLAHIQTFYSSFHYDPVIHRCRSTSSHFSKQLLPIPHATPDTYYGAGPFRHKRLRDKMKKKKEERKLEILAPNVNLRPGAASALPWFGTLSPFPFSIPLPFKASGLALPPPRQTARPKSYQPLSSSDGQARPGTAAAQMACFWQQLAGLLIRHAGGRFPEPGRSRYEQQHCTGTLIPLVYTCTVGSSYSMLVLPTYCTRLPSRAIASSMLGTGKRD